MTMTIQAFYPKDSVDLFLKDQNKDTISYNTLILNDYNTLQTEEHIKSIMQDEISMWLKQNHATVDPIEISDIIDHALPLIQHMRD